MIIGLLDVDGHNFPNVPLMKLSAYHKKQGNSVEFVNLFNRYDEVYQSKVFTFTNDFEYEINSKLVYKGGTGYGLDNKLDDEVESIYPDYDLYPELTKNIAYGFLTRGCPRKCHFCIVSEKEGCKSYKVADLEQFWRGQKEIKLLDPNLLACKKDRDDLIQQLIDSKAYVDITQGLDARLLNEELIYKIKEIRFKMVHFAWDMITKADEIILKNLSMFANITKLGIRKIRCYVLTNYNTTQEQDLYRIYKLREIGVDPYVMIYEKETAPKEIKRMARWVNNKFIFRVCDKFDDYK